MYKLGNLAGVIGLVVCFLSVLGRFFGEMTFLGFQAINIFLIGIFFIQLGVFAKVSGR